MPRSYIKASKYTYRPSILFILYYFVCLVFFFFLTVLVKPCMSDKERAVYKIRRQIRRIPKMV